MPYELHGAPATFQRLMVKVLQNCDHCSATYLDDVVICSNTWTEHVQQLSLVPGKIQHGGLTLNPSKCEWAPQETWYLGLPGEMRRSVTENGLGGSYPGLPSAPNHEGGAALPGTCRRAQTICPSVCNHCSPAHGFASQG